MLEFGPQRRGQRARYIYQCQAVVRHLGKGGCVVEHTSEWSCGRIGDRKPQVFQSHDGCIRNVQLQPANQSAMWPWPCPIAPWASRGLLDGPSTSLVYAPDGIIDKDSTPLLDPSSASRSMRETDHQKQLAARSLSARIRLHTTPRRLPRLSPGRNHTATFYHTLRYSVGTCPFVDGLVFVPRPRSLGCLGSIRRTAVLMTRHLVSASYCQSILLLDY